MSVAVVGNGCWGKNITRSFKTLGELRGIYDVETIHSTYNSFYDVLHDPGVKGVVISTPPCTHYQLAKEALKLNRHIFIEKPMTLSYKEADELVYIAKYQKCHILVGHIMEYHPAILQLRKIITDGVIGDIVEIFSHRLSFGTVREKENVWWSFAPHDILLIINTINSSIKKTDVTLFKKATAIANFWFENGVYGHVYVSWFHPTKVRKFTVIGTKGTLEFNDIDKSFVLYDNKITKDKLTYGSITHINYNREEPLMLECKDFLNSIKTNTPPKCSGTDGAKVVRILEQL